MERFERLAAGRVGGSAAEIADAVRRAVEAHRGERPPDRRRHARRREARPVEEGRGAAGGRYGLFVIENVSRTTPSSRTAVTASEAPVTSTSSAWNAEIENAVNALVPAG